MYLITLMDKDSFFKKFKLDFLLINEKLSYYETGIKVEPTRCITHKFSCGFHFASNEELIPMFQPLMSDSMRSNILQTYTVDKTPALNNYMPTVFIGVEENEHEIYFSYDPPEPFGRSIELNSLKKTEYHRMVMTREDIYEVVKQNLPDFIQDKLKTILFYYVNPDTNSYTEFYKKEDFYVFNYYLYYKIRVSDTICNTIQEVLRWINPSDEIESFFKKYSTAYISYLRVSKKKLEDKLSITVYIREY